MFSEKKEPGVKIIPRSVAMNYLSELKVPPAMVTGSQAGPSQPPELRNAVLTISVISEKTARKHIVSTVTEYFLFPLQLGHRVELLLCVPSPGPLVVKYSQLPLITFVSTFSSNMDLSTHRITRISLSIRELQLILTRDSCGRRVKGDVNQD